MHHPMQNTPQHCCTGVRAAVSVGEAPAATQTREGAAARRPEARQRERHRARRSRHTRAQRVGLAAIARGLNHDDIPTGQGGRQWWPSTVRVVLLRPEPRRHKGSGRFEDDAERDEALQVVWDVEPGAEYSSGRLCRSRTRSTTRSVRRLLDAVRSASSSADPTHLLAPFQSRVETRAHAEHRAKAARRGRRSAGRCAESRNLSRAGC